MQLLMMKSRQGGKWPRKQAQTTSDVSFDDERGSRRAPGMFCFVFCSFFLTYLLSTGNCHHHDASKCVRSWRQPLKWVPTTTIRTGCQMRTHLVPQVCFFSCMYVFSPKKPNDSLLSFGLIISFVFFFFLLILIYGYRDSIKCGYGLVTTTTRDGARDEPQVCFICFFKILFFLWLSTGKSYTSKHIWTWPPPLLWPWGSRRAPGMFYLFFIILFFLMTIYR